jgi:hypothetical protein
VPIPAPLHLHSCGLYSAHGAQLHFGGHCSSGSSVDVSWNCSDPSAAPQSNLNRCLDDSFSLPDLVAAASRTLVAAANLCDRRLYWAGHLHPGHVFVSTKIEKYGHLGRPVMHCILTLSDITSARSLAVNGSGKTLNSNMRVCARVRIPVCPEPPLVFSHKLLGRLRTESLVVSPLRIACVFLHWERGRSSKRVWRSHE